jgi:hypothetical protein
MPLRALRLSRLARYEKRLDDAEALSERALTGTATPRVLFEKVYVMVARGKLADVPPLLSKYPAALGPLATWLSAYAIAVSGKTEDAKGKVSSLDPPPQTAPLPVRAAVAIALAAMKDKKRGTDLLAPLLAGGSQNPDLVDAATSLGFRKVDHIGGGSTYEP